MLQDFGFFSHISLEAIPHYVPFHLFADVKWTGEGEHYINVVNHFFAPLRGTGSEFWLTLDEVPRLLYGGNNGHHGSGPLDSTIDFALVASRAKGYLWTGEKVAMSFAPLEAMACGCPLIVPDNMDWTKMFTPNKDILVYVEGDKESLLSTLARYEEDSSLRLQLSENGKLAVKTRFSLGQFRAKWQRIIEAAMGTW